MRSRRFRRTRTTQVKPVGNSCVRTTSGRDALDQHRPSIDDVYPKRHLGEADRAGALLGAVRQRQRPKSADADTVTGIGCAVTLISRSPSDRQSAGRTRPRPGRRPRPTAAAFRRSAGRRSSTAGYGSPRIWLTSDCCRNGTSWGTAPRRRAWGSVMFFSPIRSFATTSRSGRNEVRRSGCQSCGAENTSWSSGQVSSRIRYNRAMTRCGGEPVSGSR